ncbi:MAG: 4'-phosphopantetheinyl transferase superfamily protein [Ruthenibacterium lactatiformans]
MEGKRVGAADDHGHRRGHGKRGARCAKHQAAGLSGKGIRPCGARFAGEPGHAPADGGGQFCRKEAFGKALGTGLLREFALCEAEALRDENGAPYFSFQAGRRR